MLPERVQILKRLRAVSGCDGFPLSIGPDKLAKTSSGTRTRFIKITGTEEGHLQLSHASALTYGLNGARTNALREAEISQSSAYEGANSRRYRELVQTHNRSTAKIVTKREDQPWVLFDLLRIKSIFTLKIEVAPVRGLTECAPFKVEFSTDGKSWTTVHEVSAKSQIDNYLERIIKLEKTVANNGALCGHSTEEKDRVQRVLGVARDSIGLIRRIQDQLPGLDENLIAECVTFKAGLRKQIDELCPSVLEITKKAPLSLSFKKAVKTGYLAFQGSKDCKIHNDQISVKIKGSIGRSAKRKTVDLWRIGEGFFVRNRLQRAASFILSALRLRAKGLTQDSWISLEKLFFDRQHLNNFSNGRWVFGKLASRSRLSELRVSNKKSDAAYNGTLLIYGSADGRKWNLIYEHGADVQLLFDIYHFLCRVTARGFEDIELLCRLRVLLGHRGSTILSLLSSLQLDEVPPPNAVETISDNLSAITQKRTLSRPEILTKHGMTVPFEFKPSEPYFALMKKIQDIFIEKKFPDLLVFYGSLLGLVRAAALIPHDDDCDMLYVSSTTSLDAMVIEQAKIVETLKAAGMNAKSIGPPMYHVQVRPSRSSSVVVDLFPAFLEGGKARYWLERKNCVAHMELETLLPGKEAHFFDTDLIFPANPEQALLELYGNNWRVPMKSYKLGFWLPER